LSPQQKCRRAEHDGSDSGHGGNRLMVRGEIKSYSNAECDGHPGQQTPGAGFGAGPCAQLLDDGRPCVEARWRDAAGPRRLARRPGTRITLRPAWSPAPLCHPTLPTATSLGAMLPQGVSGRIAERMRNAEENIASASPAGSPHFLKFQLTKSIRLAKTIA
jgi:hypothetical protein